MTFLFAFFHEAGSGGRSGTLSSALMRSGMLHDFPPGVNVDLAGDECTALLLTSKNGGSSKESSVDVAMAAAFIDTCNIVGDGQFNLPCARR